MNKKTIGMAIGAAAFLVLGSVTAWAESSNTESTAQKPAKAAKKSSGKKDAHAHTCKKCGMAEKDCKCEDKKHEGHEDEHKGHSHDESNEKK